MHRYNGPTIVQVYEITVTKHNKRRNSENKCPYKDDSGQSTPLQPRETHCGFTLGLASAPTAISHQAQSHPCANLHHRFATRNAQCLNPNECCQHQTETNQPSYSKNLCIPTVAGDLNLNQARARQHTARKNRCLRSKTSVAETHDIKYKFDPRTKDKP